MLKNESILCFAPDPWDDIWRNRHQIMSLLSRENRVLYVEPRPYLRPLLHNLAGRQTRIGQFFAPRVTRVNDRLHVYHPPLHAPLSGRPPLSGILDALRISSLRRAMRQLQIERPILWLFRPDMADVPGRYGEQMVIYHIVDEYTGYADVGSAQARSVQQREQALAAKADLVLVTSKALLNHKGGLNPHTYWVPNAVDYGRFAEACAQASEPAELAGLPRPRLGYVGAINDKLDTDLLLQTARSFPQGTLVLVGPRRPTTEAMQRGLAALQAQPNVAFVDRVPVERVPFFVAACDVGLLPYRLNAWTEHIHPLKMYEYLACGLPVVATDIPSVRDEDQIISIAQDTVEFVRLVRNALEQDSGALKEIRQERASRNTWHDRVERISELIDTVRAGQDRVCLASRVRPRGRKSG